MPTVHIPASLRAHCDGCEAANFSASTLREVVEYLEAHFPRLSGKLRHGDSLAAGWAASVDGVIASRGLRTPVNDTSEIHFHPAIGGG